MHRALERALASINVLPPTYEPGATGHIPEMLELIGELVARGHAYAAEDGSGDVYFDVRSWPSYGELSGQRVDDMQEAGDADPRGKRDPRDFALWKGWKKDSEPETAAWPSPYGPGRPGWHIECSAMAGKYLGAAFDIHGGGIDLQFPHHENEQAQSRAAGHPFATYWMHNAWITTAGEKMSKSLGNSLLVPAVLAAGPRDRAALLHGLGPLPLARGVLVRGARRGGRRVPPDRELPRAGRHHRAGGRAAAGVRRRDGRRPRHARRDRRRPRHRARGQPAARRGRGRRQPRRPRVLAMLDTLGLTRTTRPGRATTAPTPGSPRPSTRWSPGCSSSAPRRGPTRTSRPPTRSATRSRPPASRSRTPRPARSGASPDGR